MHRDEGPGHTAEKAIYSVGCLLFVNEPILFKDSRGICPIYFSWHVNPLQIYLSYQQILTVFNFLRERFPFLCLEVLDIFQESMCICMYEEGIY